MLVFLILNCVLGYNLWIGFVWNNVVYLVCILSVMWVIVIGEYKDLGIDK